MAKSSTELSKKKGKRLQQAREMVRFNRKDAAKIAEVSVHTYKGWEVGKYDGLPEKRAKKLLPALEAEGLECTLEWIMHGIGEKPKKIRGYQVETASKTLSVKSASTKTNITDELKLFCQNCKNPLYLTLTDDAMSPQFMPGDIVAGEIVPKRVYKNLIGAPCIIQLKTGKILLRQLQLSSEKGCYDLICSNAETKLPFCLSNVEIADLAIILWHRREVKI